jgi:AcrR family transcriptional regulator
MAVSIATPGPLRYSSRRRAARRQRRSQHGSARGMTGAQNRRSCSPARGDRTARGTIQREGAEQATVRRIAKVGGFSIGVLAHYFTDKDELIAFAFQWVAREWYTELDAAIAAAAPGLPRLRTALEFMVPTSSAPSFIRLWLSLWGGAMHNPALARAHRGYYTRWRRYLTRHLGEAVRRGQVAAPRSPRDAVDLLTAGVDGIWIGSTFEPGRFPVGRRRLLVTHLLRSVLGSRA